MKELEITSRRCRDQLGAPRVFHYFLTIDLEDTPRFACESYGVRVSEENGATACIPGITSSAARIDELMTLLVDNRVGPVGVADVVADWL